MSSKEDLIKQVKAKAKAIIENKDNSWVKIGRPEQQMPEDCDIWLLMAGRGFGKTRAGSEAVKKLIEQGYKNICLIGNTIMDTRKIMVEGDSGILSIFHRKPKYYPSRQYILWPNGAKAHLFSGEQPDSLRGPQFDAAWIDELAKFQYAEECWNQLMMSVRLGKPKIIITTTPRPIPLIRKLVEDKNVFITRGSTLENRKNLAPDFINRILTEYKDTKFGRQEIYGEIVEDDLFELWNQNHIQYKDFNTLDEVVIGVDPAVTNNENSDETGIVVAGRGVDGNYYIIQDYSDKFSSAEWPRLLVSLYHKFDASRIVVEVNQGGDLVQELISQADPNVIVEPVRAMKNKFLRAQAIVGLYEQGKVFHTTRLPRLEEQMLTFSNKISSPDRVDAMVWALTYLKQTSYCLYDL